MTAVEEMLEALVEAKADFEDGYAGRTQVSATRARKALMTIKKTAHAARKELLAVRDGEQEPVELDVDYILSAPEGDVDEEGEVEADTERAAE